MLVMIRALRRMRVGIIDRFRDLKAFMSDPSQASYDKRTINKTP